MQKQKRQTVRVNEQILRMRKLYSQIGEPLPVDMIFDLCRHLDNALELADARENGMRSKKTACGKPN